jgi:hypothetical protein
MIRSNPSTPIQVPAKKYEEVDLETGLMLRFHERLRTLTEETTAERKEWADELSHWDR